MYMIMKLHYYLNYLRVSSMYVWEIIVCYYYQIFLLRLKIYLLTKIQNLLLVWLIDNKWTLWKGVDVKLKKMIIMIIAHYITVVIELQLVMIWTMMMVCLV